MTKVNSDGGWTDSSSLGLQTALANISSAGALTGPWGWRGFTWSGNNTFANAAFAVGAQYAGGASPAQAAVAATGTVPGYVKITQTGTGATTGAGVVESNASSSLLYSTGGLIYFRTRCAALTSLGRYWIGFGNITSIGVTTYATDTPNAPIIGFRWSKGTDDANGWQCFVGKDNVNVSSASSTVTLDNNFHVFEILVSGSNYLFYIDGTLRGTVANTNQPLNTTALTQMFFIDNQNTTSNNPSIGISNCWWYVNY